MSKGTELVKLPEKNLKPEHLFCLSYINYKLFQPIHEKKMRVKTPFCNSQWINNGSKLWAAVAVNIKKKKNPRHHYNLTNVNEHTTAKGNESEFIKPLDVAINF